MVRVFAIVMFVVRRNRRMRERDGDTGRMANHEADHAEKQQQISNHRQHDRETTSRFNFRQEDRMIVGSP